MLNPTPDDYEGFDRNVIFCSGTPFSLEFSTSKVAIALRHILEGEPLGNGEWRTDIDLLVDYVRACFRASQQHDLRIDIARLEPTRNVNAVARKLQEMAIETWRLRGTGAAIPPGVARTSLISVARLVEAWDIGKPAPEPEPRKAPEPTPQPEPAPEPAPVVDAAPTTAPQGISQAELDLEDLLAPKKKRRNE